MGEAVVIDFDAMRAEYQRGVRVREVTERTWRVDLPEDSGFVIVTRSPSMPAGFLRCEVHGMRECAHTEAVETWALEAVS